ncbi:rCG37555 [Rattus norvegicus]|uniref:RCG37555 n=1 Tax=Rattus norvegicus TaxID=10116 RepID=A6KQI1_RAT|nr:rCG37555 [Rattus norvegicus]
MAYGLAWNGYVLCPKADVWGGRWTESGCMISFLAEGFPPVLPVCLSLLLGSVWQKAQLVKCTSSGLHVSLGACSFRFQRFAAGS